MSWAIRHHEQIRKAMMVVGSIMILANLAFGPTPFLGRLELVGINAIIVPFAFYGARWTLQLQIHQHGLRPWIRQWGIGMFYFFAVAAILAIPISFSERRLSPWAAGFLMFAATAYSSLATIVRAEEQLNARSAS